MKPENDLFTLLEPYLGWLPPTYRLLVKNYSDKHSVDEDSEIFGFVNAISLIVVGELAEARGAISVLGKSAKSDVVAFSRLLESRVDFMEGKFSEGLERIRLNSQDNLTQDFFDKCRSLLTEFSLPTTTCRSNPEKLHPEAIFIQLLTECNARCDFCPHPFTYHRGVIHKQGRMNETTWFRILNDMMVDGYCGQVGFYLHHEPLLSKDLFSKISDVNKLTNAYVVLSTNGALFTDSVIDKLKRNPPRKIHVNISSGDKSQYERAMQLDFDTTMERVRSAIDNLRNLISFEINCPVVPGVDKSELRQIFSDVKVNDEFEANSRGGLIESLADSPKSGRFNLQNCCNQPSQNLNILTDGSVIACCQDWMQESKSDFKNVNDENIFTIYRSDTMIQLQTDFQNGIYTKYKMCGSCSLEMGFYRKEGENIPIMQI